MKNYRAIFSSHSETVSAKIAKTISWFALLAKIHLISSTLVLQEHFNISEGTK